MTARNRNDQIGVFPTSKLESDNIKKNDSLTSQVTTTSPDSLEPFFTAPITHVQQRIWLVHEFMKEQRGSYNIIFALHFEGYGFCAKAMRSAIDKLLERHESLRTSFMLEEGECEPLQIIKEKMSIDVPLRNASLEDVNLSLQQEALRTFDLSCDSLLHFSILRITEAHHVLVVCIHHIISDGWSLGVMMNDLRELYREALTGEPAKLPELTIQYADYAIWDREQDLTKELTYWRNQFDGYQDGLPLPYDNARTTTRAWRSAIYRHSYPKELASKLLTYCRSRNSTLFMGLMTALAVVLHRYTQRQDICVGTTVAGRPHMELENLIGFFINILPLRLDLTDNPSLSELMQRVRNTVLKGFEHQALPFEHLLNEVWQERDSSQIPLVPVVLRHQNFPFVDTEAWTDDLNMGEFVEGEREVTGSELDWQFFGDGQTLELTLEYAADLFSEQTIKRMAEHHQQVLEVMVSMPDYRLDDVAILTRGERHLFASVNGEKHPVADEYSLIEYFEHQAAQTPHAVACIGVNQADDYSLTSRTLDYAQLNARANQVARQLINMGVGPDTRVAVYCDRSIELVMGLLAIFKAGACYVPIDPQYPPHYREQILDDVRPQVLLTVKSLSDELVAWSNSLVTLDIDQQGQLCDPQLSIQPEKNLNSASPDLTQLACVMYTSGSTGKPKGVMVPYAQLHNWLEASWQRLPFGESEVMLQKTSIAFAVSVKELLSGLLKGVPLLIMPDALVKDTQLLLKALAKWQVTRLYLVPSHLQSLLDNVDSDQSALQSLRYVITAGEPLPQALRERVKAQMPEVELWNNYGCTELNDVTYCRPDTPDVGNGFVPIGYPIRNTGVYVLDEQLRQVPIGVIGELHVESIGLARGYLNQPGLTAQRFIANPYGDKLGDRLFKTGDLVRYLGDGSLEFMGRHDFEVKIRGYRVDLSQIEKVMATHPQIFKVVVAGWSPESSDAQLLAYVVGDQLPSSEELRLYLNEKLPTYMVPTLYVFLDSFPRLPNGKLDHQSLPAPELSMTDNDYVAPRTETEIKLAELWAEVLSEVSVNDVSVGMTDNFFDLGGHSLNATQMFLRIRQIIGVNLPMTTLFDNPVLKDFSRAVELALQSEGQEQLATSGSTDKKVSITALQADDSKPKLFCLHPIGGQLIYYSSLAKGLASNYSVHGLKSDDALVYSTLAELASHYCDEILINQPEGPYRLLGWSSGGLIMLAVLQEFQARGCIVNYAGLIDTNPIPKIAQDQNQLAFFAATNILVTLRKRSISNEELDNVRKRLQADGWSADAFANEQRKSALAMFAQYLDLQISEEMLQYIDSRVDVTAYYLGLVSGYLPESQLGNNVFCYRASEELDLTQESEEQQRQKQE